jgi:hypothetical protein
METEHLLAALLWLLAGAATLLSLLRSLTSRSAVAKAAERLPHPVRFAVSELLASPILSAAAASGRLNGQE